jgi:alkyl hydroperoxide reductase subunit F
MIYDLIIVGGGPAGLTAGIYAGRKKINAIILTDKIGGESLGYTLENYPGIPSINGLELVNKIREQVEKSGVAIKDSTAIAAVEKKNGNFLVKNESGESFEGKAVIVAAGTIPRKLNVPGAKEFEGKGVSFCTVCDAPLFAEKSVAVVGGGNAALIAAMDLLHYAKKIYVLQHRQRFIGDEIMQEKLRKSGKAELIVNAETTEIKGEKPAPNRTEGSGLGFVGGLVYKDLKTKEKKELAVEGVFVNIGSIPNTSFVKNFLKLNEWSEIIVDSQTMETSVKGIFAAGDITSVPYKQYIIAAGEGAKAALSAYHYICNC